MHLLKVKVNKAMHVAFKGESLMNFLVLLLERCAAADWRTNLKFSDLFGD